MQPDLLRATARAIYDAWFPTEDPIPDAFEEAERNGSAQYRRAVTAAQVARLHLLEEPTLF